MPIGTMSPENSNGSVEIQSFNVDAMIGKVLAALERTGEADNTVISFWGDHGWQLGDLGEFGKKTNFERATRAPLIVRNPKRIGASFESNALVEFVDIMPTF